MTEDQEKYCREHYKQCMSGGCVFASYGACEECGDQIPSCSMMLCSNCSLTQNRCVACGIFVESFDIEEAKREADKETEEKIEQFLIDHPSFRDKYEKHSAEQENLKTKESQEKVYIPNEPAPKDSLTPLYNKTVWFDKTDLGMILGALMIGFLAIRIFS